MDLAEMNLIFVDVEAVGATPISGVMTEFGAVHYHSRETFHGVLYSAEPGPVNRAKPVLTGLKYNHWDVADGFRLWVKQFDGRPIFVSDNNGYDYMWMACLFDQVVGVENPFGHSSRRISDFYAGLVGDFAKTQHWKKWRVTPHTHHPVDDAMGNVEAFAEMLRQFEEGWDG